MGIRIHKILGYGIVNLNTKQIDEYSTHLDDPRINPNGILGENSSNDSFTEEGFVEHCRERIKDDEHFDLIDLHLLFEDGEYKKTNMYWYNILTYDSEYGKPSVLCITHPGLKDWYRFDDVIDYYEEYPKNRFSPESYADVLTVPIYPFDAYINNETGEYADQNVRELIYQFRNAEIEMLNPHTSMGRYMTFSQIRYDALNQLGCDFHWTEKWNVIIPSSVEEFCRYTKLFVDEKTIWQLQPMIYTYWS